MIFDARTGFLSIGLLNLIIAVALWGVLSRQRANQPLTGLAFWCGGGLFVGVSTILFALRGVVPELLSFTAANVLMFVALAMRTQSLRLELGEPESYPRLLLGMLAFTVVYECLRQFTVDNQLPFHFAVLMFGFMSLRVVGWAWRLGRRQGSLGAFWIAGAYALLAITYVWRLSSVALGLVETTILTREINAFFLIFAALISVIFTNIGYLGIALEQSIRDKLAAAAAQARAEENQRLSEQLTQLDRQRCLGTMSASLGHELNQPLTAILTNAQTALRSLPRTPSDAAAPTRDMLDRIVHNTQRASQIIERIRGFIRPRTTQCEPLAFDQLVPEVVKLIAAEARAQRVTLILEPNAPPLRVMGDPIQLSQILINVLRNAIEALATVERRDIRIGLSDAGGRAILRVQDTGPGLTPETRARVGEPFFTTKATGLGMGLSLSQTIAEQHGGTLTITNAADGGALVELSLPALPVDAG
ncbi:hypothetical protein CCR95_09465 [Thiocystis minor]|uniref:sensor histidine kinase n=1 Tax=Thiocystis minor TaxID=61597 RepID=UPI0019126281|nr:ATP-binding protein [Thiocystis minor]MBK5964308.1 hypothetical protein [Thiocystis minor]